MSVPNDPVNDALRVLRDREWAAPEHRARLKEMLMNKWVGERTVARRNSALIAAGVGIVALGSLGFVAAERLGLLSWTVRTEINGQEVDSRQVTPDADGKAEFTVDTEEGAADVTITESSDGRKQITVDLSGGAESATVKASDPK